MTDLGEESADERVRNVVARIVGYAEVLNGEDPLSETQREQMTRAVQRATQDLATMYGMQVCAVGTTPGPAASG